MEVLKKDGVEKIAVMMSIVSNTGRHRRPRRDQGLPRARQGPGRDDRRLPIPGAWEEEGAKILGKYGIEFRDRCTSMWEAAGEAVAKIQGTA